MNRTGVARLDVLLADETIDELLINEGGRLFVERHGAMTSVEPPLPPAKQGMRSNGFSLRSACEQTQ